MEQAAAWLFRVARNRITNIYRRKRPVNSEAASGAAEASDDGESRLLADLLPAPDDSPKNRLLRETLMEALSEALAKLPAAQRQVFILVTIWRTRPYVKWRNKPACPSKPSPRASITPCCTCASACKSFTTNYLPTKIM